MYNLEQIRAAAALESSKGLSRSAVNKLPALLLQNGLLATAAFCDSEGGGEGRKDIKAALDATAMHLSLRGYIAPGIRSVRELIGDLSKRDSHQLQRAAAEALAFIAYLKRFAPKD